MFKKIRKWAALKADEVCIRPIYPALVDELNKRGLAPQNATLENVQNMAACAFFDFGGTDVSDRKKVLFIVRHEIEIGEYKIYFGLEGGVYNVNLVYCIVPAVSK